MLNTETIILGLSRGATVHLHVPAGDEAVTAHALDVGVDNTHLSTMLTSVHAGTPAELNLDVLYQTVRVDGAI